MARYSGRGTYRDNRHPQKICTMNISNNLDYKNYIAFISTPHKKHSLHANRSELLIRLSNVVAKFRWYLTPIVSKLYTLEKS